MIYELRTNPNLSSWHCITHGQYGINVACGGHGNTGYRCKLENGATILRLSEADIFEIASGRPFLEDGKIICKTCLFCLVPNLRWGKPILIPTPRNTIDLTRSIIIGEEGSIFQPQGDLPEMEKEAKEIAHQTGVKFTIYTPHTTYTPGARRVRAKRHAKGSK